VAVVWGEEIVKTLLVVGHPHSGTTWLCRALARACAGATPVGGGSKHAWGGVWRVIRTHSGPDGVDLGGIDKVLLTRRDPRDVAQSLINRHPHQSPSRVVKKLCVQWPTTLDRWRPLADAETSYEAMRADGAGELRRLALALFEIELSEDNASVCLEDYRPSRGPRAVGAWRNDLEPGLAEMIAERLGGRLKEEGY
jgi:hypothetical protein